MEPRIDTDNNGHVDKTELKNADKKKGITASTLVRYLTNNYDSIDQGAKGIDASDITRYWQQQTKPEAF